MEESIFVDEGLQVIDGDEDEPLLPLHHHSSIFLLPHLKKRPPQATTSSTAAVEASQVDEEIISEQGAPSHV
jgi:hypothetical protein